MKVCSAFGPGFYYIPGTDQCIKVGGRVRVDAVTGRDSATSQSNATARADDLNNIRARGYLYMDQRQNTEYGLLRTYARLSFTRDSTPAPATAALFEFAYVQFAGFTFGRFQNPYENTYYSNGWIPYGAGGEGAVDNTSENGAAYTATLGNGVTATLAVRAPNETKAPGQGLAGAAATTANLGAIPTTFTLAQGQSLPDGVAALEVTQGWGSAKIAGAVHQVRYANQTGIATPSTDYGYGGIAGVKINLPQLAAGDFIGVSAQYAKGANLYAGVGTFRGGQTALATVDAVATTAGRTNLSTAWGVNGGFDHYWTKTVDTNFFAAYASYENSLLAAGATKANHYTIGQYTKWSPVAGLQIGIETDYRKNGGGASRAAVVTGGKATELSDWSGRLRVQRDF